MPNSRVYPLPDQVPLQLGNRRDYREKRLTKRTAGVNVFLVGDELDTEGAEFLQGEQQVFRASSKAIKAPYHNGIKLPFTSVGHECVEFWPRVLSARFAHVDIFSEDFEFPRGAIGSQVAQLKVAALILGADACIDRHSHSLDLRSRGRGGQGERSKRPFLSQEKASPKVLILPAPITPILAPFLRRLWSVLLDLRYVRLGCTEVTVTRTFPPGQNGV